MWLVGRIEISPRICSGSGKAKGTALRVTAVTHCATAGRKRAILRANRSDGKAGVTDDDTMPTKPLIGRLPLHLLSNSSGSPQPSADGAHCDSSILPRAGCPKSRALHSICAEWHPALPDEV